MYALFAAGVVALLGISLGVLARKAVCRRREELARLQGWLREIADAKSDEELAALNPPSKFWDGEEVETAASKRKAAIVRLNDAQDRRKEEAVQAQLRAEMAAIHRLDDEERRKALIDFPWLRLNRESRAQLREECERFFAGYAKKLYAAAEKGSSEAFFQLCGLVETGYTHHSASDYCRATGENYSFPVGWDELMVGFVKMPIMEQFHNQLEVNAAAVQDLAPRALSENNLVMAKWVLAATRGDDADALRRRRAVGEIFHGRLLDFVNRQHAAMQDNGAGKTLI